MTSCKKEIGELNTLNQSKKAEFDFVRGVNDEKKKMSESDTKKPKFVLL